MPTASKPFDGNFTTWVDGTGGGSPSKPGATDINRIQNDLIFLSSKPAAKAGQDTAKVIASSFTPTVLVWNVSIQETDKAMIPTVGGSTTTDRIFLPYFGDWELGCVLRTQYNNTAGGAQLRLWKTYQSGHVDVLVDTDFQPCSVASPVVLRTITYTRVDTAEIPDVPAIKVDYAQNSGGDATIPVAGAPSFAYPVLWARWLGTSAV